MGRRSPGPLSAALCRLGLHRWIVDSLYETWKTERCTRCGRTRVRQNEKW